MIQKKILNPHRVRAITGSFAYIEHRFKRLNHNQLLLYFFLVLAADKRGLSYYSYDKICSFLGLSLDDYIDARDQLMENNLIAFDGTLFQVLSLPGENQ
jgi:hypothetical protein